MFKQKLKFNKQGNIALILVIMVTTLTLVSALTLALINISDLTANYHLLENENVVSQKDACAEEAMHRISQNLYATGTYYLTLDNIYCDYQLSDTVAGLKTVTTTASTGSSLGYWQSSSVIEVNVSSTPISINSYKDLSLASWDSYGWQYRMKITVNADQVVGELHNFPVYVDLADLGSEFFDNVRDNGADIVVTTADGNTKLLKEIINFSTAGTGEMHFLAPILVGGLDNYFYIYFGNDIATESINDNFWLSDYSLVYHFAIEGVAPDPLLAHDSSKGNNDGTTYSMNAWDLITCKLRKCFDFDGSVDTLEIDNGPINMNTSQGTISFWVNFTTLQSGTFFHFYESLGLDQAVFYYIQSGSPYIALEIIDGGVEPVNVSYSNPNTSGWHKIDLLQDGSSVKMYYDGRLVSLSGTNSGSAWLDHFSTPELSIGNQVVGSGPLAASVDEMRITSKALSSDWLITEYNNQNNATAFYSTSTPEALPVPPPPECAGILAYGRCWFEASATSMSCDQVCAENAKTCVPNVSYGGGCTLNELFDSWACSAFACVNGTGWQTAPSNIYSVSDPTFKACAYDTNAPAYTCSELSTDGTELGSPDYRAHILCACE